MTHYGLGRTESALQIERDVYSGRVKLNGEEREETLQAAMNYAWTLGELQRFEEAKSLLRKTLSVARRVLGDMHDHTIYMRRCYAETLYLDDSATLDDLREAVTTLEETERIARRVLGGAHPLTSDIEDNLQDARAALRARSASLE